MKLDEIQALIKYAQPHRRLRRKKRQYRTRESRYRPYEAGSGRLKIWLTRQHIQPIVVVAE